MPGKSGLHGPYDLDRNVITAIVRGVGAGGYGLERAEPQAGIFTFNYVGRSDTDLASRLGQHADAGRYKRFKYGFLGSATEAFMKECFLFHEFGEERLLDNKIHPQRPAGQAWRCAHCKIFG